MRRKLDGVPQVIAIETVSATPSVMFSEKVPVLGSITVFVVVMAAILECSAGYYILSRAGEIVLRSSERNSIVRVH